jgi:uncharacterized protein YjiS (DUF1127 family)
MNWQSQLSTINPYFSRMHRQPTFGQPSLGAFRHLLARLALWHDRSCQRRQLAQLDERLLADIGKSREEARQECGKPFWR